MDNPDNTHYCNLQGSTEGQRELDNAQATMAVVGEEEATPTSKEVYGSGIPSPPQSPQRASSPPVSLDSIPEGPSEEASTSQGEELEDPMRMLYNAQYIKVYDLVDFLLFKYQMKAFTTKAEMLESIGREYDAYYPLIFSEASECLKLVFGIDMIEVDPFVHSYILVTALGLTYDGMLTNVQGKPKTGLLIVVLGVIFMKGNCVSEEIIWKMLNNIGLRGGRDPYIHQDPRKLISEEFVQEGYLEYRQVPNSDPLSYEFLWGPRAFAETTKMKVLEFFASIAKIDPRAYTERYAEALRDELERAQARTAQQMVPLL
ncbi:melanoma-associated antigen 10-like [Arvicanthis niloticus]|uniref:melanoma-associated antigen 10-like n=1 Tax=Arvicanthis niloticus TaxID=61156 RepID=UPI001486722D|nr:melanoma-associated antigen 10-like [Arvicanthis niloticus]